ncbi:uncharacterized protein [Symphalangus syndactylus]|uniref:uncharacterized protein n=1 Tax=Symphalangus syndactylus TaxID=9590 RepID=UPI0030066EC6
MPENSRATPKADVLLNTNSYGFLKKLKYRCRDLGSGLLDPRGAERGWCLVSGFTPKPHLEGLRGGGASGRRFRTDPGCSSQQQPRRSPTERGPPAPPAASLCRSQVRQASSGPRGTRSRQEPGRPRGLQRPGVPRGHSLQEGLDHASRSPSPRAAEPVWSGLQARVGRGSALLGVRRSCRARRPTRGRDTPHRVWGRRGRGGCSLGAGGLEPGDAGSPTSWRFVGWGAEPRNSASLSPQVGDPTTHCGRPEPAADSDTIKTPKTLS